MKKIFIYTAILATVATACSKLENEPLQKDVDPDSDVVMITEKVSANVNPSSKADIDADAKFTWSAGDQLAVHVSDGNYYTTEALASGGSKSATFSVTYPDGQSRDAFAIYPASIVDANAANYGQSSTALDVTLPASYTLAEVSGTKTPCPMIAVNTGDSWTFKQLCGMLRLTINGIPADATGLKIQFPDSKVNGSFSLESPVSPETSTIATTDIFNDGEDKITVNFAAGITSATVNIPLPTGDYNSVYISSVGGATKVVALHHIKANGYTAARAKGKKLTTTVNPLPVVTRSDGGDEDECIPSLYDNGDIQYDFTSPNFDPAKITIDGNSTFRFYFDTDPAVVTLTGSGDPVSSTWTGHNAFIESDNDLTIRLDCNYLIDNSFHYECDRGIDCGGTLKLATTGETQTLTVITNSYKTYGIYGDSNYDAIYIQYIFPQEDIPNLAVDGFKVSCPGPVSIEGGKYKWVYTVTPKLHTVTAAELGKVIGANGDIYDDAAAATSAGTTAIAMIAYVGSQPGVCDHGLAISLTDIESYQMNFAAATGEYAIPVWAAAHPVVGGTWRLPSEKDWQYMMWGYYTATPDPAPVGTINTTLSSGYYWTSTVIDDDNAKGIYYDGTSNASVQELAKTDTWHVRACLSF